MISFAMLVFVILMMTILVQIAYNADDREAKISSEAAPVRVEGREQRRW